MLTVLLSLAIETIDVYINIRVCTETVDLPYPYANMDLISRKKQCYSSLVFAETLVTVTQFKAHKATHPNGCHHFGNTNYVTLTIIVV